MEVGLCKFINNKFLSDIAIKIEDVTFRGHKIIIAASSAYYSRLFENDSKNEVPFPPYIEPKRAKIAPKLIFESILKYMYSDQRPESIIASIDENTADSYMAMAYSLGISSLMGISCDYIIENLLQPETSVDYLSEGLKFYSDKLIEAAMKEVLSSFQELVIDETKIQGLLTLPYKILLTLISSDELKVSNERIVYDFVCRFAFPAENKKPLTETEVLEIFSKIRWPYLTHSDLLEAASNPKISGFKDMVLEGLSVQLSEHNKPRDYEYKVIRTPRRFYASLIFPVSKSHTKSSEAPIRFLAKSQSHWKSYNKNFSTSQPRPPQSHVRPLKRNTQEFLYSYDFDENGALFYLGSLTGTWRNPHESGMVSVFASSVSSGRVEDLVGRSLNGFRSKNEMNACVGVDFGESRSLKVAAYTIRNGNSSSNTMTCWNFEGSVNGNDWVALDRRINTNLEDVKYLAEKGKSSTWGVGNADRAFRFFRIVQIDKNYAGNYIMSLSCFELYGVAAGIGWNE